MSGGGGNKHHEEEHEEHVNHEAWVIPYADMLTLLMALFLVLFALGRSDEEKMELAANSFRAELEPAFFDFGFGTGTGGNGPLSSGSASVLEGLGTNPTDDETGGTESAPPATNDPDEVGPPPIVIVTEVEGNGEDGSGDDAVDDASADADDDGATFDPVGDIVEYLGDPLTVVEKLVREKAEGTGLADAIGFRRDARGLVVTIVTDRVLFGTGSADIQPDGLRILDVVADSLATVSNDVLVEGHTDSRPISTARYPSNWELSTSRATSVLRYLVEARGFPAARISAAGFADTHPVATGGTAEDMAKNRRVEIVVLATSSAAG
jgi:chemotaxis protein MotB